MYQKDGDSYIYIQSDYSLESEFNKSPCNDLKEISNYSFDRSTPQLQYSGSIESFQNKRFLDTNQSTPSAYNCRIEERSSVPISSIERNRRLFLDLEEDKFDRERSYNLPIPSRTVRSSTCNVRIPCELEESDSRLHKLHSPILNHKINNPNFYTSNIIYKKSKENKRSFKDKYGIDNNSRNNYIEDNYKSIDNSNHIIDKDYYLIKNKNKSNNRENKNNRKINKKLTYNSKSNNIDNNNINNINIKNNHKSNNREKIIRDILDLESQNTMNDTEDSQPDLDEFMDKSGRDLLLAPEFASDEKTRKFLSLGREVFMAVVGCQVVYILASLLFGNVALAIIVFLLLVQSCFCHCDGRPLAYFINALLSLSIGVTVIVALAQEVSGLEPFRTEPVLKTLSYVYIPLCFFFTVLSAFLAFGYRRLFNSEKKAIVNATNNLLGSDYYVDPKSMTVKNN